MAEDHAAHAHVEDGDDHHGRHHSGMVGAIRSLFVPHSHDVSDSLDSALTSSREGMTALRVSLAVLAVTATVQAGIAVVWGSVGLRADTIHNAADALTAIPLGMAFWVGRRRATTRYTYGYGRAEDLAGLFIVAA